jgi:hypothetical protein
LAGTQEYLFLVEATLKSPSETPLFYFSYQPLLPTLVGLPLLQRQHSGKMTAKNKIRSCFFINFAGQHSGRISHLEIFGIEHKSVL